MNPTTIKQKTATVTAGEATITVRRMYHKAAREFLKKLAAEIAARAALFNRDAGGQIQMIGFNQLIARLPEFVGSGDSLADFLVANSTDDPAALEQLDLFTWGEVLKAALELNCGAELKNFFAGIRDALAPLLAEMTTKTSTGVEPTPS